MKLHCLALSMPLLLAATQTLAADAASGEKLVNENCQSCHGDEVYSRADRKVQSLEGLDNQVRRCELALGLRWFDEQIEDTAAYLNQTYYHYK